MASERRLPIQTRADALGGARVVRGMALEAGLSAVQAGRAALVACELASNMVRHAGGGILIVRERTKRDGRNELMIVAHDTGPEIPDLDSAFRDGSSAAGPIAPELLLSRGGLGTGLGAIVRLADALELHQGASGKAFVARFVLAGDRRRARD